MAEVHRYIMINDRRPKGKFKKVLQRKIRRFLDRETKEAIDESVRP